MRDIIVTIKSIAPDGQGVGSIKISDTTYTIFVPFAVPGDVIEAHVEKQEKRYLFCRLGKMITPSPDRIEAPCPVFTKCGGCQFLNLEYPAQLKAKQAMIIHIFKRLNAENKVLPIIASPKPMFYRHRVKLYTKEGKWCLTQFHAHELIPINRCWLMHAGLDKHFEEPAKEAAMFMVDGGGHAVDRKHPGIYTLTVKDRVLQMGFTYQSFIQTNLSANTILVETVCKNLTGPKVLDLYAGVGNFSLPAACLVKQVVAVESNLAAAECARNNVWENKLTNIEILSTTAEEACKGLDNETWDTIILDPTREGASRTLEVLPSAKKIIYVGCEIVSMIDDLKILQKKYVIESIQPIDMFAQTRKIECVVILSQRS